MTEIFCVKRIASFYWTTPCWLVHSSFFFLFGLYGPPHSIIQELTEWYSYGTMGKLNNHRLEWSLYIAAVVFNIFGNLHFTRWGPTGTSSYQIPFKIKLLAAYSFRMRQLVSIWQFQASLRCIKPAILGNRQAGLFAGGQLMCSLCS